LFHRFTVRQYEHMTKTGILTDKDKVELLDGWIVDRMAQNPPLNVCIACTHTAVSAVLLAEWYVRDQKAIRLSNSEPEPDLAVVRAPARRYLQSHPTPADIAVVIEAGDSSVVDDREWKGPIYARARLPQYWLINIPERKVEVYTDPKGGKSAGYRTRHDYGPDDSVPLIIEGREIARIPVRELLP
jgi:Uma2 family endonuclease